jgi:hypothetical protein
MLFSNAFPLKSVAKELFLQNYYTSILRSKGCYRIPLWERESYIFPLKILQSKGTLEEGGKVICITHCIINVALRDTRSQT